MAYSGETYDAEFKTKVVLKALRSDETDTSVANAHDVHPVTLSRWKNRFLDAAPEIFATNQVSEAEEALEETEEQLEDVEADREALRSVASECLTIDQKVAFVREHRDELGLNHSCELVDLPKSTYYYRARAGSGAD